jgi:hypothetical protein
VSDPEVYAFHAHGPIRRERDSAIRKHSKITIQEFLAGVGYDGNKKHISDVKRVDFPRFRLKQGAIDCKHESYDH